jgi:hypothetical protein
LKPTIFWLSITTVPNANGASSGGLVEAEEAFVDRPVLADVEALEVAQEGWVGEDLQHGRTSCRTMGKANSDGGRCRGKILGGREYVFGKKIGGNEKMDQGVRVDTGNYYYYYFKVRHDPRPH